MELYENDIILWNKLQLNSPLKLTKHAIGSAFVDPMHQIILE